MSPRRCSRGRGYPNSSASPHLCRPSPSRPCLLHGVVRCSDTPFIATFTSGLSNKGGDFPKSLAPEPTMGDQKRALSTILLSPVCFMLPGKGVRFPSPVPQLPSATLRPRKRILLRSTTLRCRPSFALRMAATGCLLLYYY